MKVKARFALVLAWLLVAPVGALASGAPAVTIAGPQNGSMLLTHSVVVNGTASGSEVAWQEALKEDFETGTLENLTNDAAGTLALNRTKYDTFDGAVVDPGRWTETSANGLGASISGGKLLLSGSSSADGWASRVQLVSTVPASDKVDGTLEQFMEVGTGAYSVLGLWQDDQNFIAVGRVYDFYDLGPGQQVVRLSSVSGTLTMESLGAATEASHAFAISYDGSSAVLYMDGTQLKTVTITLSGARCMLRAAVNASYEFISAVWDDVSCLYLTEGRFTSAAQDTLSDVPAVTSVSWTASLPSGLSMSVRLRSADSALMQGASAWSEVTSGQSSGFPAFQRYLQYQVLFGSPTGNGTPLLRDITVKYICEVKMVDVSIDNRTTWTRAWGKEDWNVTVDVPDGPSRIWARVTDVTGDMQFVSININVDTTEPTVSLLINDGAAMAPDGTVNLTVSAFDAFGVESMIVSEDENLTGAVWQPFAGRLDWELSAGDGPKTVYVRVRDTNGWESAVASAGIQLDTRPPTGTVRINAGGNYSRSPTVTLYLNASDASGVSDMLLSNRADFSGDDWLPYTPVYTWTLTQGTGARTVHARFRDPAGHMSVPVTATVVLDTVLPVFTFAIENGSAYTRSYDVELEINATDNNVVADDMISSNGQFPGAAWEPWAPLRRWTLTSGEGPASLYVKVRDAADNEAKAQAASITVDTVAPLCVVSSLQATTTTASFTVGWNGNDATSGITGYDVQYREGNGSWTDWQVLVANTTAVFTGQDGLTYTFRARAHDLAGNIGDYPENPKTTTTIKLPVSGSQPPLVSILTPQSSAPYKGKVKFEGTARALAPGRSIASVQWQIDDGAWLYASGKENWSFLWDTAGASQGPHTLRVRSFDGQSNSTVAERNLAVDNPVAPEEGGGTDLTAILVVLVVVIVAGAIAGAFVMRRRKKAPAEPAASPAAFAVATAPKAAATAAAKPLKGPSIDEDEDLEDEPEAGPSGEAAEAAPAAAPPEAEPAGEATEGNAAPAGETPAGAEATPAAGEAEPAAAQAPPALEPLDSTPRPPLELVRQIDPARILAVVQAILPSLPGELQYMAPDLITQLVVSGEQGKSKFGEPLVVIMNRWYFADETKPTFLQRYNW
jgi:hypothetical protein